MTDFYNFVFSLFRGKLMKIFIFRFHHQRLSPPQIFRLFGVFFFLPTKIIKAKRRILFRHEMKSRSNTNQPR